jgi:hypothetical protein
LPSPASSAASSAIIEIGHEICFAPIRWIAVAISPTHVEVPIPHFPFEHTVVALGKAGQTILQLPKFLRSVCRLLQTPPQSVMPGGRAFIITGSSPESENTIENPKAVSTQEAKFVASGNSWEYSFRRHSITWLEFDLKS